MREINALIKRNTKLFFKDKGLFFTSLITPLILLVLYTTFLGNIYKDVILSFVPEGVTLPEDVVNGFVGGQLISSILAVSCVTIAFCSNMLMVQDKVSGALTDIRISPVKRSSVALGYYFSTFISTMIICIAALGICLIYIAIVGWYMSVSDVLFLLLDIFLLVMFGTALSSIINVFLSSQGQISAVGTIVSSGYGFICGAYMPIAQFSSGLQKVISFLPGTYGTSLVRNHALNGIFNELGNIGFPHEMVDSLRSGIDCNLFFFGDKVAIGTMYLILGLSVAVLIGAYIIINSLRIKK